MATAQGYKQFLKLALSNKNVNLTSDPIKLMLCTSDYTPDPVNHTTKADVTNEVSGEGYTTGGKTLTVTNFAYSPTHDGVILQADPVTWESLSVTFRYGVLYVDIGTQDSDKPLIGYIDFGTNITISDFGLTISWQNGIVLKFSVSST